MLKTVDDSALKSNLHVVESIRKFVPIAARAAIESGTYQMLGELRTVVTIFIEILNLENDFKEGLLARPQEVFRVVIRSVRRFGGLLRQYVVDDKGCVIILGFGTPGTNFENNSTLALETAISIKTQLEAVDIKCRIGRKR